MYDIDPGNLIDFATRWAALGTSITDQVIRLLDDASVGSCFDEDNGLGVNPAAIRRAFDHLHGLNEGLDDALGSFLAAHS